ncbi:Oligopeptide transport system permease protein appB [Proteiniborus sp. DW1]|uniref:ABC transporter permease n=1 Tax=Proteiniborus sp. DW1 TaxID=1889883 RepID=UPI00092DEF38|nr:ABC transporter permease [Proteiniborus sp. DW1]SCG82329.1 Oligopeptide transport system permease protein appB [Proteiniborus sp. DW1]
MIKYTFQRIIYMIFVFSIMSVILFTLYNMIPGDPARAEVQALKATLKPGEYEKAYQQARQRLGLDDPLIVRYGNWAKGLLKGDLGMSQVHKQPVSKILSTPLSTTIFINIFSVIIGLGLTIPLGIFCAVKKNSAFDKVVQVLTIIGYSIPVFIFALLFIYAFAVKLGWFPVSGMKTPNFQGTQWEAFKDTMKHLALPLMVMTIGSLGGITRYVRAAMVDALSMDYIKTARAKGLKEKVVIFSHAWRNALLPVVTLIIGWFMSIFYGSLIIERMFNLNGLGKLLIDSLNNQDYNVVMAIQLLYMLIALLGNLISDLSYGIVDPRVRVNK